MARSAITCSFCRKKGARVRRITRTYGRGPDEVLIRNIPTVSCSHCGETYLTAATLHELERIKTNRRTRAVKRRIAVAEFPARVRRRAG